MIPFSFAFESWQSEAHAYFLPEKDQFNWFFNWDVHILQSRGFLWLLQRPQVELSI